MHDRRSERGAQIVELAIVVPLLLFVFGGIVEFGLLFRTVEVTTNAAREGARLASIPGNEENDYASVRARVNEYLTESGLALADATTTFAPEAVVVGTGVTANGVRVNVAYTYHCLFLGPIAQLMNESFASEITHQSTAVMRTQIAATGL